MTAQHTPPKVEMEKELVRLHRLIRKLGQDKAELLEALGKIANDLHRAANGGLKRPGKPDLMSEHKFVERNCRDIARAAIAKAGKEA